MTPNPASNSETAEATVETDTQTARPENSPVVTGHPDTKGYTISSGDQEKIFLLLQDDNGTLTI